MISVIVTVYNRAPMIAAAIGSLARQSVDNLEIIVIDDGSTDDSAGVVERLRDPRIRLIRHESNRGIPAARNSGLETARGQYIAWLDSDDLARPGRLETQARFLDANPDLAMIGGCAGRMAEDGQVRRGARVPMLEHEDIRAQLLFRSAFQQSSIMGRADILKAYPYSASFPVCEDIDMFVRLTADHGVANLPVILVDRRLHAGQTIHRESPAIRDRTAAIARRLLASLDIAVTENEIDRHVTLGNIKARAMDRESLDWSEHWLMRIGAANRAAAVYDPEALAFVSGRMWLRACLAAVRGSDRAFALNRFVNSRLTRAAANRRGRAWFAQAAAMMLGVDKGRR